MVESTNREVMTGWWRWSIYRAQWEGRELHQQGTKGPSTGASGDISHSVHHSTYCCKPEVSGLIEMLLGYRKDSWESRSVRLTCCIERYLLHLWHTGCSCAEPVNLPSGACLHPLRGSNKHNWGVSIVTEMLTLTSLRPYSCVLGQSFCNQAGVWYCI